MSFYLLYKKLHDDCSPAIKSIVLYNANLQIYFNFKLSKNWSTGIRQNYVGTGNSRAVKVVGYKK